MNRSYSRSPGHGPARIRDVDIDVDALGDPLIVTDVAEAPGRNDRFRVSVNDVALGNVSLDVVAGRKLVAGRQLTKQETVEALDAVRRTLVLDKALDVLAARARSSRDLGIRLRRAGASDEDVNWVRERLTQQGYLDDAAYARQVARARAIGGGVSRRRVMTALRQKGIAADVASEAIASALSDVELDEYGAARAAAEKRARALASLEPAQRRQRLYAFLARRGYEGEVIRRVLKDVLS
ncbi:MAG TPA: regulatory protein RecX [Gemmatimonadaceae bacterium]